MIFKLLNDHHLEFLSLKGGCTGLFESTLVKMPHRWKSHVTAQMSIKRLSQVGKGYLINEIDARKPVFGVSDKERLKPVYSATKAS